MSIDLSQTKKMLLYAADEIINNVDFLTEVDKMGDADHGIGMETGFKAVKKKIANKDYNDLAGLFKDCGTAIMMSSGGASGVIYGTLFRGGSKNLEKKTIFGTVELFDFLNDGLHDVMKRGGAKPGDKTIIDALYPTVEAIHNNISKSLKDALDIAYQAAFKGSEETKKMTANFGRMKTLGKRSKGHPDPGSVSFYIIMKSMLDFINRS